MLAGLVGSIVAILVIVVPGAGGAAKHVYPVTLTIAVDRAAGKLSGEVFSDAPAQFCEMSTVRVRRAMRGRDKVVARVRPNDLSEWRMKSPPALRGKRVYAEVLPYHLPERPVECLGARSRAVTAP